MWVDGDLGPRGNDVFETLQLLHKFASASVGCTSAFARFMPSPILPSKNFLEIVDELNVNIEFVSAREAIDTSGPRGRMFLTMVGSIAELKRSLIVERIKNGTRVKNGGQRLGRAPLDVDRVAIVRERVSGMSLTQVAKRHRVSRGTVLRLVREANQREIIVAA
jgi:DNA invertase Pin-like site-specific DNA recombinase